MKGDGSMENIEVLRRIISILDRYTTRVENNIRFGVYPFIAEYNGNIRMMNMSKNEAALSLCGWLLPVGIPVMMRYGSSLDSSTVDRGRVVGYYLGNGLYIHEEIFERFVNDYSDKEFFVPNIDDFIHLTPGGWSVEEQKGFNKYLWQLSTKSLSGDFREIADINFEARMDINRDVLFRDGWVSNRIAGRNIFYGIVTCPVDMHRMDIDTGDKYLWYNKYITILDVTGGNGIQTFGNATYSGNYHPHVSNNGSLCRGNAVRIIQDKLNSGMLTEFFIFMKDFLSSYSDENPFVHLPVHKGGTESPISGSKYIINKIYHEGEEQ
jgi:hypothetical protein